MNRIKKFIIPLLIFVFSSLASYAQNDCIVAFLANDLSSSTAEFKTIVKQSEGFQAWQLLNKEKPALRTNIEELVLVSKNLEAIKSARGYLIWKALNGAGRQSWNGFANIFKANADEILEATNRIKNHRLTSPNGGNYGYLEGTVNNAIVDNKFWRSGAANLQTEPQIFTAIPVEGSGGATWLRNTDSEYKMLNKLASDLGGTTGAVKTGITGELKIISENPYCASCSGIIQQFNQMFPNVKLILVDGVK